MPGPTSLCAVLTGDLVRSQEQQTGAEPSTQIRTAFQHAQRRFGEMLPYPIDVFRGDSWQVYVADPASALEIALLMRAALQMEASLDTRIAIAVDRVDTVEQNSVSESSGPAFRRSGQALDALQKDQQMRCLLPEAADDVAQLAADALCDLADHLATHWTEAQAQAIALRLMLTTDKGPPSQSKVAQHWQPEPITQQAVSKHLRQAAWTHLDATLNRFEQLARYLPPASTSS